MASNANTAGAGKPASTGAENQAVGKVFIQYGTAKAVAADGTERALAPNSPIFAHDQIITGSDGSVSIQFDGPPVTQLDLGRMSQVTIDEDVYAGAAPGVTADAAAEAEQIQQALLEGDQPIDLEATAAGGDGGAGGGVTSPFSLSLTGAEGDVNSGAGTNGPGDSGTGGNTLGAGIAVATPTVTLTTDSTDGGAGHNADLISNDGSLTVSAPADGIVRTYTVSDGTTSTTSGAYTAPAVDGTYTVVVTDTDGYGNESSATITFTLDTTIATPTADLASDTGADVTDHITQIGDLTLSDAAADVTRTFTINGEASSTYTAPTADGTYTVVVNDVDTAGNHSSTSITFTVDNTIATPTADLVSDTGADVTDHITQIGDLTLSDAAADVTRTFTINGEASSTYTAPTADGEYTVVVNDVDIAGNHSSTSITFTVDNTIADPTAALVEDTGSSSADGITQIGAVTFSAVADDVTRTFTIGDGEASSTYTAPTADGTYTVVVNDVDTAGNHSSTSITFTVDNTIATPTADLVHDTGADVTDHITQIGDLTLSDTAADVTRTFTIGDGEASSTYTAPTVDGTYTVVVNDVDIAGNHSSTSITFTLDHTAPMGGENFASVDDEGLGGGIVGGLGDITAQNPETTFNGTLSHDGAGNIDFALMNGTGGAVGTEHVTYSWNGDTNTLTATVDAGDRVGTDLFQVLVNPTSGAYTVTLLENVLHDTTGGPVVSEQITINTDNYHFNTGKGGTDDMVRITVHAPGDNNDHATLINNASAFGITSDHDGNEGYSNEINYLGGGHSEVMSFALQSDHTATQATVTINAFYADEHDVGHEVGSYALYNNGNLIEGSTTTFTAPEGSNGLQTLNIAYAGGFDEIRFSALEGTHDHPGGDSSDYNVSQIIFDNVTQDASGSYENNATAELTYTVTDSAGNLGEGTLNISFNDDTPVAYDNTVDFNAEVTTVASSITISPANYANAVEHSMVHITVDAPSDHGHGNDHHHATLNVNDNAGSDHLGFGITSNIDGHETYSNEINHLNGHDRSEVMSFELQNDHGEAAKGSIATSATVEINAFYPNEAHVGNEVGSYALYNNGHQVQGPTTFTAEGSDGHQTLNIAYEGGFDEIRFSALEGTADHHGGDSSDYNVESVTFGLVKDIGQVGGNLLDGHSGDTLSSFGADGGHVLSVAALHDGTIMTGEGHSDNTPSEAGVLTVTGEFGGILTVESDGEYIYKAPTTDGVTGHQETEAFNFTLVDGDGDTASATLSMLIDDPNNPNGGGCPS